MGAWWQAGGGEPPAPGPDRLDRFSERSCGLKQEGGEGPLTG